MVGIAPALRVDDLADVVAGDAHVRGDTAATAAGTKLIASATGVRSAVVAYFEEFLNNWGNLNRSWDIFAH